MPAPFPAVTFPYFRNPKLTVDSDCKRESRMSCVLRRWTYFSGEINIPRLGMRSLAQTFLLHAPPGETFQGGIQEKKGKVLGESISVE